MLSIFKPFLVLFALLLVSGSCAPYNLPSDPSQLVERQNNDELASLSPRDAASKISVEPPTRASLYVRAPYRSNEPPPQKPERPREPQPQPPGLPGHNPDLGTPSYMNKEPTWQDFPKLLPLIEMAAPLLILGDNNVDPTQQTAPGVVASNPDGESIDDGTG